MDHEWGFGTEQGRWYTLRERLMFTAVVIMFAVIIFMVSLRLYVRWYLLRQMERRGALTGLVFYGENNQAGGATADHGLDAAVLESLPVFLYSSREEQVWKECAVCLSEFEENEAVRLLPKCDHSFHVDCIDMWLYSHSTCPICRSKVEPVANQPKPVLNVEPGSSSQSELRQDERNLDVTAIVTTMSVRTEVPPPRRFESESEATHSSPLCQGSSTSHGTQMSSFKRLLSTGTKPPIDGGKTTVDGQGTSHGSTELDLEGEPSERSKITQRNQ